MLFLYLAHSTQLHFYKFLNIDENGSRICARNATGKITISSVPSIIYRAVGGGYKTCQAVRATIQQSIQNDQFSRY